MSAPAATTLDSIGFGATLPTVLLEEVTRRAFETHASIAMFAGFGILGLGFLWRMSQEVLRDIRGDKPDYIKPLVALIGFTALLAGYQPFVKGCIHVVSQLGSDLLVGEPLDTSFRHRVAAFAANWRQHGTDNVLGMLAPSGIMLGLLQTLVVLAYALVTWSAGLLRLGQTFMLAVIITYGPLSLGCASLGGIFGVLGTAWFWALIEVCAWGLTLDVLNYVFAPLGRDIPSQFYWVSELMLCLSLFVLIASVPLITSMLIRGQAAAMMPRSNVLSLGSAFSAAVSAQRYGQMALTTGLGATRAVSKARAMVGRAALSIPTPKPRAGATSTAAPPEGAGSRPAPSQTRGQGTASGAASGSSKAGGQTRTDTESRAEQSDKGAGAQGSVDAAQDAGPNMPPRPKAKSPWVQKFAERMHKATRKK